jgi:hypothetical protein
VVSWGWGTFGSQYYLSLAECLEVVSLALGLSNEWCRLHDVNGVQGCAAVSRVSRFVALVSIDC